MIPELRGQQNHFHSDEDKQYTKKLLAGTRSKLRSKVRNGTKHEQHILDFHKDDKHS